jgi:hypothetical protein
MQHFESLARRPLEGKISLHQSVFFEFLFPLSSLLSIPSPAALLFSGDVTL